MDRRVLGYLLTRPTKKHNQPDHKAVAIKYIYKVFIAGVFSLFNQKCSVEVLLQPDMTCLVILKSAGGLNALCLEAKPLP